MRFEEVLDTLKAQNFTSSGTWTNPGGVRTVYLSGSGGNPGGNTNSTGGNTILDTIPIQGGFSNNVATQYAYTLSPIVNRVAYDTGGGNLSITIGAAGTSGIAGWATVEWEG